MNATLIDLHVRPQGGDDDAVDVSAWSEKAKDAGIDGLVIVGHDAPPQWSGEADGISVYAGVEVDTDVGRLLCYPREIDEWFESGGWQQVEKTNGSGPEVYVGEQLVSAFASRGGAVVVAQPYDRDLDHPCGEDRFTGQKGLSAVVVTSSPRHTTSNERASAAANVAKLPGVGGSASQPGEDRFGAVATLFLRPPRDQRGLVEGLKSGRVWPIEIGPEVTSSKKTDNKKVKEERETESRDDNRSKRKRRTKGGDDDRGNRLDLTLTAHKPQDNPFDRNQPDLDPIAKLYGIDGRKANRLDRYAHMSDDELDRINGNRERGADTNVMVSPDFRELRAERQHVNLLLRTIERNDRDDSIALRFAFKALDEATPEQMAEVEERHERSVRQSAQRRRRRRRRK